VLGDGLVDRDAGLAVDLGDDVDGPGVAEIQSAVAMLIAAGAALNARSRAGQGGAAALDGQQRARQLVQRLSGPCE
jgi:hypothetical protein